MQHRGRRVLLRRLEDERVAAGDRTGNIHIGTIAGKLNGVMPATHPERLAHRVRRRCRADVLGELALQQVRDAAGELDDLDAALHLAHARRAAPCRALLPHEQHEATLGRGVGRVAAPTQRELRADRPEVDLPPAPAAGDLVPRDGLGEEHGRFQVQAVHLVERLFGHLEEPLLAVQADAVDEDVQAPVIARDRVDGGADALHGVRVERQCRRAVPCLAQPGSERLRPLETAAGERHRRPAHRQPPRDRLADPAVAAGDECNLSGEVEERLELAPEVHLGRDPGHAVSPCAGRRSGRRSRR
jgi:hypothetical protein